MTTLAPTHFCNQCGALWRQCDNGSWNLRSEKAGPCCDNVAMGSQIQPLVMPRLSPTHQSRAPRVIGEIRIDNHSKPYARLLTAYDEHGNVWREGTSIYAAPMPQAEPTSKGEPRVVVEVCPECDIDDCKHIRARREASQQREPQEAAELELLRDALRNLIETYGTDSPMWWQARAALSAPQEAGKPCATCRGKGFIIVAGNAPGGYEQEPCPDCDPSKEASKVEPVADERQPSDGDYLRWAEQAGAKINWDFESASSARVVFLTASQWGRFCDKVRALHLRPSQQALSYDSLFRMIRAFGYTTRDQTHDIVEAILAAAGGSEK